MPKYLNSLQQHNLARQSHRAQFEAKGTYGLA